MSQKDMGRVHVVLDTSEYEELSCIAKASDDGRVTIGTLIVAAVFCCLDKFEAVLGKGKSTMMNRIKVDTKHTNGMTQGKAMHVYFGGQRDLIPRLVKLAKKTNTSTSWLVRKSCQVCMQPFSAHVPFHRTFKCCGKTVAF